MGLWKSDDELFKIAQRELFSCVIGDVMDKMLLTHQFLPPAIRPLHADMILIGRAMTLSGDCCVVFHLCSVVEFLTGRRVAP
jgi:hypothetical protein